MLRTGLIITAVLAAAAPAPAAAQSQGGSATARADQSQQVVCRNQAVTGSRFTHRRCRTREQEQIAQREAQRFVGDSTRSGPSVEAIVNPQERSWIPQ